MKLLLALCALASAEPEAMTASNLLKSSAAMLAGGRGTTASAKQPLKVVAAGLGRTGTASLKEALTKLGLKTYHMKDGVMDTPGHMELWSEHAAKMMQGESGKASANAIMDKMAEDGFNATTDMPSCYFAADGTFLRRYPDAKVILTVRDSEAWATSIVQTIGRNFNVFGRLPWRLIPMIPPFLVMNEWMWKETGLPESAWDPQSRLPDHAALVKAHDGWVAKVKRAVPRSRLLVFRPTDGWGPLCAFVSPVDPMIAARCEAILKSGEPYPHLNDTNMMRTVYAVFVGLSYVFLAAPLLCVACVRRRAMKKSAKKAD